MGFVHTLGENKSASIFGGRHQIIIEKCEHFFAILKELNVSLAFFCDGSVQNEKIATWIVRQKQKYQSQIKLFDGGLNELNKRRIPGVTTIIKPLFELCKRYGYVHLSINNECDKELVRYANQNNALAIIGGDSDYLVYDGNWKYWSNHDLNLNCLTTIELNRNALRTFLNLNINQMAVFAALFGGDILDSKAFKKLKGSTEDIFFEKANFVRQLMNNRSLSKLTKIDLQTIATKFLNDNNDKTIRMIEKAINLYNLDTCIDPPNYSKELHINIGYLYNLLVDKPNLISLNYIDFRKREASIFAESIKLFVRRQMGILLQHKQDTTLTRRVYIKCSHNEPPEEHILLAEYPMEGK